MQREERRPFPDMHPTEDQPYEDQSYIDAKGRTRWRGNDEIAEKLKQLGEFLIIGGYEESHATRYGKLAYAVSRHPESIRRMHEEGRLDEISGIGKTISGIIGELLDTGTCAKWEDWAERTPVSVLELTALPGLGVKTVRTLYAEYGIDSLETLGQALDSGALEAVPGLGKKTRETIQQFLAAPSGEPRDA